MSNTLSNIGGCCCVTICFSVAFYLFMYFTYTKIIMYNDVGLKLDQNIMLLEETNVYNNGLYFLGWNQEFLRFPKLEMIERLQLDARTKDDLRLSCEISYLWKIDTSFNNLKKLILTYGGKYKEAFNLEMHSTLQIVASEFDSFEYFKSRPSIVNVMFERAESATKPYGGILTKLQVLNVELPQQFSDVIQQTVNAEQGVEKVQYDKGAAQNAADTIVIKADQEALQLTINAEGAAAVTRISKVAEATVLGIKLRSESAAYAAFKQEMEAVLGRNMTAKELLSYVWLDTVLDTNNYNYDLVLDLDKPQELQDFSYNLDKFGSGSG